MSSSPPDRWLLCPRKGKLIEKFFLPCKTPLSGEYDKNVPPANRFSPEMLVSTIKKDQKALIIDLTNTNRFYNFSTLKEKHSNIFFCKISCKGFQKTPGEEAIEEFEAEVHKFLDSNPGSIIIVHCTHGFNRTGFLIITYLVEVLQYSFEHAFKLFCECREPGIYKQDYIDALVTRFNFSCKIAAPNLPSWCEIPIDSINRFSHSKLNKQPTQAFDPIVKVPKFMENVRGVSALRSSEEIFKIQSIIKDLCHFNSPRFPGCQPVSMCINNINNFLERPYMVSWKADGTRYIMAILGRNRIFMVDRDNCVYQVDKLSFPKSTCVKETLTSRNPNYEHLNCTLLDGEMVIDKNNDKQETPRYLIYDIISYEGTPVSQYVLKKRLHLIETDIIQPRTDLICKGILVKETESFSVRSKQFFDLFNLPKLLHKNFKDQLMHETDGLIFQPAGRADIYVFGKCLNVLKWKPPELNTVEFYIRIIRKVNPGCLPELQGKLFVIGDNPGECDPNEPGRMKWVAIMPNMSIREKHYDKRIVECHMDQKTKRWTIMRVRKDKSFPNHISTYNNIMFSIENPIDENYLINFVLKKVLPDQSKIIEKDEQRFHLHNKLLLNRNSSQNENHSTIDEEQISLQINKNEESMESKSDITSEGRSRCDSFSSSFSPECNTAFINNNHSNMNSESDGFISPPRNAQNSWTQQKSYYSAEVLSEPLHKKSRMVSNSLSEEDDYAEVPSHNRQIKASESHGHVALFSEDDEDEKDMEDDNSECIYETDNDCDNDNHN